MREKCLLSSIASCETLLSARGKLKGGIGTGGGEGKRLTGTAGSDNESGSGAGRRVMVVVDMMVEPFEDPSSS